MILDVPCPTCGVEIHVEMDFGRIVRVTGCVHATALETDPAFLRSMLVAELDVVGKPGHVAPLTITDEDWERDVAARVDEAIETGARPRLRRRRIA